MLGEVLRATEREYRIRRGLCQGEYVEICRDVSFQTLA